MKEKSIMKMLEALAQPESADGAENAPEDMRESYGASAAERLGRAMLDAFGDVDDGVTEDELVDAILSEWSGLKEKGDSGEEEPEEEPEDAPEDEAPFKKTRRPVPMRTASASSEPVDYSDMSAKQFAEIKKLIKRASADGRRIRL